MTFRLCTIDPPEILKASPVEGFPLARSIGNPSEWLAPDGCSYLPVIEQEKPAVTAGHSLRKLPDEIVGGEIFANRWELVPVDVGPKTWPDVSDFYSEFSATPENPEQYLIQVSADPAVVVARAQLAMWRGEVVGTDPRMVSGLSALVAAGILSQSRVDEILGD